MKKLSVMTAAVLMTTASYATDYTLAGSASARNSVLSTSGATSSAGTLGGSSYSLATNEQRSVATIGLTGSINAPQSNVLNGTVGVSGSILNSGSSLAYNVSSGNATGSAAAAGLSVGTVQGSGYFLGSNTVGTIGGAVTGSAQSLSTSFISAGRNQYGFTAGVAEAGFNINSNASLVYGTNGLSDTKVASTYAQTYASTDRVTVLGYSSGSTVLGNATGGTVVNSSSNGNAVAGVSASLNVTLPNVPTPGNDGCTGPNNGNCGIGNGGGGGNGTGNEGNGNGPK